MIKNIPEHKHMEIENEHLYKRILQTERLTTIGRLTASLSHEINNAMQVIQGSLSLALEQVEDSSELATFLQLSLEESQKIVHLLKRLRFAYSLKAEAWEALDLNSLLQEAITLGRRELKRQQVTLQTTLAPDLSPVTGVEGLLAMVFLSLLLNLSEVIDAAGGGELQLRSYALPQAVGVEFSTNIPLASESYLSEADTWQKELAVNLGLSFSREAILAHGGRLELNQRNGEIICSIELPLSKPDSPKVF